MKQTIREFIENNGLMTPFLKNYAARRDWWFRNEPEMANFIFSKYDECCAIYEISLSTFLKWFIFDEDLRVCETYEDIFLKYAPESLNTILNSGESRYPLKFKQVKVAFDSCREKIGFQINSTQELRYVLTNQIKERPVCKLCGGAVEYVSRGYGYRDYCSAKCQNIHHNTQYEPRKSEESHDEIRHVIGSIILDKRNLNTKEVADRFINIREYAEPVNPSASVKEMMYIFMNGLRKGDVMCPVCESNPRKFISQGAGYKKTCGCKSCAIGIRHPGRYYPGAHSVARGPYSLNGDTDYAETGFLYILHTKTHNSYKIGVTQDPISRMKALRKDIPDLKIEDCFFVKKGLISLERKIHDKFQENRAEIPVSFGGHTEYFYLNDDELGEIKEFINANKI